MINKKIKKIATSSFINIDIFKLCYHLKEKLLGETNTI